MYPSILSKLFFHLALTHFCKRPICLISLRYDYKTSLVQEVRLVLIDASWSEQKPERQEVWFIQRRLFRKYSSSKLFTANTRTPCFRTLNHLYMSCHLLAPPIIQTFDMMIERLFIYVDFSAYFTSINHGIFNRNLYNCRPSTHPLAYYGLSQSFFTYLFDRFFRVFPPKRWMFIASPTRFMFVYICILKVIIPSFSNMITINY